MTTEATSDESAIYKVLVNHEEQYALWPDDLRVPDGWNEAGKRGSKDECAAYVDQVWTDLRPLSLRRAMREGRS
jgi:MbtH protein